MAQLYSIVVSIISMILKGFVVQKLYYWFIFGIFTNINLSLPVSIGIVSIINLITSSSKDIQNIIKSQQDEKEEDKIIRTWIVPLFHITLSLVTLLQGWIIHLFM